MYSNDYLKNPILPKDFYNVKCLAVETIGGILIIRLQVVLFEPYGDAQNAILHATLRDAPAAERLREMFRQTFRVEGEPAEAVGRFWLRFDRRERISGKVVLGCAFHPAERSCQASGGDVGASGEGRRDPVGGS